MPIMLGTRVRSYGSYVCVLFLKLYRAVESECGPAGVMYAHCSLPHHCYLRLSRSLNHLTYLFFPEPFFSRASVRDGYEKKDRTEIFVRIYGENVILMPDFDV